MWFLNGQWDNTHIEAILFHSQFVGYIALAILPALIHFTCTLQHIYLANSWASLIFYKHLIWWCHNSTLYGHKQRRQKRVCNANQDTSMHVLNCIWTYERQWYMHNVHDVWTHYMKTSWQLYALLNWHVDTYTKSAAANNKDITQYEQQKVITSDFESEINLIY